MRKAGRADLLVFAIVFAAAGWFHQGGGWNQNARFALVRAIVEQGRFAIDDFLVYEKASGSDGAPTLRRRPVQDGKLATASGEVALAWRGPTGAMTALDPAGVGARKLVAVDDVAASGDLAWHGGHLHPNKAPGTSFLAVPGYALVRVVEALLGVDPDSWAALTRGAWLASLFSVGLATALAAVLVLQLAREIASERSARLAALGFAFATMALPYSTMLFEHDILAFCLVAALWCIERARPTFERARGAAAPPGSNALLFAAGAAAGWAAITNYTMAALVPLFAAYLAWQLRSLPRLRRSPSDVLRPLAVFGAGVAGPLALILFYNVACFGTPLTTNYAHQSTQFLTENRLLGVFALPRADVALLLLFSPFRGLFFSSPVLLAAFASLALLWRDGRRRELVALVGAVFAFLLFVNASFNGWDGGWTAVPRYLGPAMALLAIPLAVAFDRWTAITSGLAAVSLTMQLLLTVVDPQVPIGDVGVAGVPVAKVFWIDPMKRYVVPLFTKERAWPVLEDAIEQQVARASMAALKRDEPTAEIEKKAEALRADLRARIERGEPRPTELGAVTGPVSANPIGLYEGWYFRLFPAGSAEARGNSFNLGELLFPDSRLSLLPLLLLETALLILLFAPDAQALPVPAVPSREGPPPERPSSATPREPSPAAPREPAKRRRPRR